MYVYVGTYRYITRFDLSEAFRSLTPIISRLLYIDKLRVEMLDQKPIL